MNLRVTRNAKNLGCGMTRQVGIDNTTADYIAFLDSDDVYAPTFLEEMYKTIKEYNTDIAKKHKGMRNKNAQQGGRNEKKEWQARVRQKAI